MLTNTQASPEAGPKFPPASATCVKASAVAVQFQGYWTNRNHWLEQPPNAFNYTAAKSTSNTLLPTSVTNHSRKNRQARSFQRY